ncbi:hypothetical protein [Legionella sainthelensi]|uniref:hypothetical protein n=1 Tax=Legionella sainthelensi TaxID=28087 RepID=UPI000E1FE785|nr:hypothetical protein [Legionella sainthelensi]
MLEKIVICSDPNIGNRKNTELWRHNLSKLGCQVKSVDKTKQEIPEIKTSNTWFNYYNENAPHKGLNMMSPRQFLKTITG